MWFLLLPIAAAALVLLLVGIGLRRRRHRHKKIAQQAWEQWKHMSHLSDPSRRVLEAENILDRALRGVGYQGTFGEKLKRMQKTLPNVDAVWHAHKLRNRIAHEPGIRISEQEAEKALSTFKKAMNILVYPPKT